MSVCGMRGVRAREEDQACGAMAPASVRGQEASMRGPGVVSSAVAPETAVDQLAHDLGIEPIA